ncbi:MAG: filamentous hemagglutinin N-terminal domain-containing protein, partial [Cyanobacteria bacterium P01_A01_bin.68]
MKGIAFLPGFISGFLCLGIMLPASSQVTSDNTTNTTVNTNNNNFTILNGIQKGNNLFHSFKEFSIPKGGSAIFKNSTDVLNIINRVTGGNISNIDGLIKANGNANLFLINPQGIVFGENARLDIGGSFLGSTASSILFEDGFNYSAIDLQQTPLLTISAPIGLQMGQNPGDIRVKGNGHNQIYENASLTPFNRSTITPGVQVSESKTIGLIGGNI